MVRVSSYMNVYDKPNGKTQTAYVTHNQLVFILTCVKDENNVTWVEITWGDNGNFRGWLPLDRLYNITGVLSCQ